VRAKRRDEMRHQQATSPAFDSFNYGFILPLVGGNQCGRQKFNFLRIPFLSKFPSPLTTKVKIL
jgi:hypothetical protein